MRTAISLICLLLAGVAQAEEANRLVGSWVWNPVAGSCREIHTYNADGTAVVESGGEILRKTYEVAPASSGMLRVTATVVETNGGLDCLGSTTAIGASSTVFILFTNGGDFYSCASEDGMSCFGSASRQRTRE